jgi:hypothetical protein
MFGPTKQTNQCLRRRIRIPNTVLRSRPILPLVSVARKILRKSSFTPAAKRWGEKAETLNTSILRNLYGLVSAGGYIQRDVVYPG